MAPLPAPTAIADEASAPRSFPIPPAPATAAAAAGFVDTVIVGTGPSALILSYILNGNLPYIRPDATHPDPQLQAKLANVASLFDADFQHLSAHFLASRLSYSTQALPVNTLLDTLIRPLGDTAPGLHDSCIAWQPTTQTVDHLVLGADHEAGGQWQENPVHSSMDVAALSYADLLTLPGYSMAQYMREQGHADADTSFLRPTRKDVATYLAIWPQKTGIASSLRLGQAVEGIERTADGHFHIASHALRCRHVILATGSFTDLIPPRDLLQPLLRLQPAIEPAPESPPLLVVGSGFSAADVILTNLPRGRRVLHIFKWDTSDVASPLRACHPSAYPEYASVFRRMRRAATDTLSPHVGSCSADLRREVKRRRSSAYALESPAWDTLYEGLPNTRIQAVNIKPDGMSATIILERPGGGLMEREICGLQYVIGRQGSLAYVDRPIRAEILGSSGDPAVIDTGAPIKTRTLRGRAEHSDTFEMAPGVFVTGSLLGDSLIRHAYGGCCVVARELIRRHASTNGEAAPSQELVNPRLTASDDISLLAPSKDLTESNLSPASASLIPTEHASLDSYAWAGGHEYLGSARLANKDQHANTPYDFPDAGHGSVTERKNSREGLKAF